jgi:hypothetical protein
LRLQRKEFPRSFFFALCGQYHRPRNSWWSAETAAGALLRQFLENLIASLKAIKKGQSMLVQSD